MNGAIVHDYLADAQKHFSQRALRNEYFAADGIAAVTADSCHYEIHGQHFCHRGGRLTAALAARVKLNLSSKVFPWQRLARPLQRIIPTADCPHLNDLLSPALISPAITAVNPKEAFCFILKPTPVFLRVKSQFYGRINVRDEKTLCSILELSVLKNS